MRGRGLRRSHKAGRAERTAGGQTQHPPPPLHVRPLVRCEPAAVLEPTPQHPPPHCFGLRLLRPGSDAGCSIIDGELVLENGVCVDVDEAEVTAGGAGRAEELIDRAGPAGRLTLLAPGRSGSPGRRLVIRLRERRSVIWCAKT